METTSCLGDNDKNENDNDDNDNENDNHDNILKHWNGNYELSRWSTALWKKMIITTIFCQNDSLDHFL